MKALLKALITENEKRKNPRPILLKIAPDLSESQLDDVLQNTNELNLDGLIISNTTVDRTKLSTSTDRLDKIGAGGLSGVPVRQKSNEVLKYIRSHNAHVPIIAVGGIMAPEDAIAKIVAGANLVQVYTGLVYRGPGLIKRINRALVRQFEQG